MNFKKYPDFKTIYSCYYAGGYRLSCSSRLSFMEGISVLVFFYCSTVDHLNRVFGINSLFVEKKFELFYWASLTIHMKIPLVPRPNPDISGALVTNYSSSSVPKIE